MPAEGFFQRWSRLKSDPEAPLADAAVPAPHEPAPPVSRATAAIAAPHEAAPPLDEDGAVARLPSLADVAELHAGSDYSVFFARGVDKSVQRGALKKLFADPHFNIGDGLDLYMGDYNKPDPIPAAMMSALRHTQSFFAQAYPDKKKDADVADAPGPASDDADGQLALTDMAPPMAGTPGASATTVETSDTTEETSDTTEDNA